jgi:hypothetical protein
MKEKNIIIRIDLNLQTFLKEYAKSNHTSMTEILTRYIHTLYLKEKKNANLQNNK